MNGYLLISGAIQPDTTRPRGRSRKLLYLVVTTCLVVALTAIIVRARAMDTDIGTQPAATSTR